MRALAELVGIMAGAAAVATYLGINIRQWRAARRPAAKREEKP